MKPVLAAARQSRVYHIILSHGDSLAAVVVVLGDAQGGGAVVDDGEAPGTALRLVAGPVVHLSRDGVHPFRQAHGGSVGEAARCVDLGGDHFAVDDERCAERLDARAGLWACPELAEGSDRVAEMTGHEVVMTDPLAGVVSLMRGGWPS
jgi:hypothetical protein